MLLNYDFAADSDVVIKIKDVKNGYFEKDFEVESGRGKGIIENVNSQFIKIYLDLLKNDNCKMLHESSLKQIDGYYEKLDIGKINGDIDKYLNGTRDKIKPKSYIMNITLAGFDKEIKRKITADSNLKLYRFCRAVIIAMRGDLSHSYRIKVGKEYLEDEIIEMEDLNYLELKEKQRLKVIYDFGNN